MIKLPKLDSKELKEELIDFIRKITKDSNSEGIVIGLSGGIDSTVVAYLLKEALGKDKVFGYHLYSSTTPKEDTYDAKLIAKLLEIEYKEIAIDSIFENFLESQNMGTDSEQEKNTLNKVDENNKKIAEGNLKARIRMSLLYYFANLKNCLVAGTGNKSELLIGYFTKYGDGGCDFELIGDIYKTQLKQIAISWNIPKQIINKTPRAGLWLGQSDEDEIGLSYEILDKIIYLIVDKKLNDKYILKEMDISISDINSVRSKIDNNQHKIQSPPNPFTNKKLPNLPEK